MFVIMATEHPILTPMRMNTKGWYVEIDSPEGGCEQVGVFQSKHHAQRWILEEAAEWIWTRGHWKSDRIEYYRISARKRRKRFINQIINEARRRDVLLKPA